LRDEGRANAPSQNHGETGFRSGIIPEHSHSINFSLAKAVKVIA
jgi:hypothetical protein